MEKCPDEGMTDGTSPDSICHILDDPISEDISISSRIMKTSSTLPPTPLKIKINGIVTQTEGKRVKEITLS